MTDQPIFHLHIPKTGGSSLITLLEREYGDRYCRVPNWSQSTPSVWQRNWGEPEQLRQLSCISGHYYFGFVGALNKVLPEEMRIQEPVFLTFMRHPVDRLLSLYHYWRTEPNRYRVRLRSLSFEEFALAERKEWAFLDNDMVRRIAGVEGANSRVTEADFERAIRNLSYFPLVGITDCFDATIERWAKMFGWQSTAYTRRLDQPDRLRQRDLDPDLVAAIEDRQSFDCVLYARALARDW